RLAGIGIADQRDDRPRCAAPALAMEAAGAAYLFQLAAQAGHAIADHPPVGLDLRLARPAEEPEAAALTFEVGPRANEAPRLVIKVGQFNLEPAFRRRRPFAKDLQDQAGAVDHLALELFLKVALLDRGERAV